jgi:ABC-type Zn uptake system ZnuABC Zn-binding protein ZnuA
MAVAGLALALGLLPSGCGGGDDVWPDRPGPKVVVSFAPVYCWAVNVAGDDAVVKNMMTTTGPHDFNPTDTDARLVRRADLFFINGLGLDNDLAGAVKRGSGNNRLAVIDLGARLPADQLLEGQCNHDHAGHDHKHDHGTDPHVWLNPDYAVTMTEAIRDELKKADPGNAANYDRRAAEYVGKLRTLKAEGLEKLKGKTDRKLVSFHESLAYFARSFDLTVTGVVQKTPGQEPNTDELAKLIDLCKAQKVRLVAVEPQYTANTSAKAVLDELARKGAVTDAALVEIDPMETVTPAALTPAWYEERMRANLDALARAMK